MTPPRAPSTSRTLRSATIPAVILCLATLTARAEILTVDNNPDSVAMFTSTADAYEAAEDGDTLLIAGSPTTYASLTVYKRLTIIGPGYLLGTDETENDIPGLVRDPATVSVHFRIDPTIGSSSNSRIVGITGRIRSDAGVEGLLVEKCRLTSASDFDGPTTVRGCLSTGGTSVILTEGCLLANSIVNDLRLEAGATASHSQITRLVAFSDASSISNSIFVTSTDTPITGSLSHCLAVGNSILPDGAGNINDQAYLDVFENSPSIDGRFRLAADSPARGAGLGGADIGPFGGATPYVVSGVPGIPRITRLVVPATASSTDGLQFEIDASAFAD